MKVFVTGSTGFVGSHLVEGLIAAGHKPVCLVRSQAKADQLFRGLELEIVHGDLDDTKAIARGCQEAQVVVHAAGLTAARNRAEFHRVNVHGTQTVARIAASQNTTTHFIYVSSLAAAGPTQPGKRIETGHKPNPVSQYGWSKLAGEEAVQRMGVPWTIMRPPTVYGPRDTEVLKLFKFARLGIVPVLGSGEQENSFVYVADLVQAILKSVNADPAGKTYFPCHSEIFSQRELVSHIGAAVGRKNNIRAVKIPAVIARNALWVTGAVASIMRQATLLNADRANDFLAESWTCSPDTLETDLGWRAEIDLPSGLERTARWYTESEWL